MLLLCVFLTASEVDHWPSNGLGQLTPDPSLLSVSGPETPRMSESSGSQGMISAWQTGEKTTNLCRPAKLTQRQLTANDGL